MVLLVFAELGAFMSGVSAHYDSRYPPSYAIKACKACRTFCPPYVFSGKQKARHTERNPVLTWRRGQKVNFEWFRNNHEGGFVSVSLVPLQHRNNFKVHSDLTFWEGCFNQNRFYCGRDPRRCGTDKNGIAYKGPATIPTVYPDGVYVLGMVWMGGLAPNRKSSLFSDFTACSFIRIRGGITQAEYPRQFSRGVNRWKDVAPGTCRTTSVRPRECGGGPCRKPAREVKPPAFWGGRRPKIYRSAVVRAINSGR